MTAETETQNQAGATNVFEARANNRKAIEDMGINPYPTKFETTTTTAELHTKYEKLEDGEKTEDKVSVAGRVMAYRNNGMFIDLKDHTGKVQIFSHKQDLSPEFLELLKKVDIGDIIGIHGLVRRTPRGELTVNAHDVQVLTKSMRPLPEKYHGLTDVEARYRHRYVDLIMNDDSKAVFEKRSKIISYIRHFLEGEDFLEVETPMMHPIMGGATAKPFVTYHNALDRELYMRVAPELYLKRLIVGGFHKVFEINRCFRNEGISIKHNPEFTSVELYQAYADYNDMMALTERLVEACAKLVSEDGSAKLPFGDNVIDFSGPWPRKTMTELILEHTGVDFLELQDPAAAQAKAKEMGIETQERMCWGEVIEEVFGEKVEPSLIQPIHVVDMPKDISPLAKGHSEHDHLTERFESYANGWEIANAFSELNDPIDQRERFQAQVDSRDKGNEEAQMLDEDFIEALEYGMPPTGGLGIGIDRLIMLLTNSASIRDVIAFPSLRNTNK